MVNNKLNQGFVKIQRFSGLSFTADISETHLLAYYDYNKTNRFPLYLVFQGVVYKYQCAFADYPKFSVVYVPTDLKVSSIAAFAVRNECVVFIEYCDDLQQ